MIRTAAIIVAAGLSSRMGTPKPLLPLRGQSFIRRQIGALRGGGAAEIVVVTGHAKAQLEEHLRGVEVTFLPNERYAESDMFASVRIALAYLSERCDRALVTPADVPAFSAGMVRLLLTGTAPLSCPAQGGRTGHPVLIGAQCFPPLLADEGKDGLRGALARCGVPMEHVPADGEGSFWEANTPEEYRRLAEWFDRVPDREECLRMLAAAGNPERVVRHCAAVADTALSLARRLHDAGCELDLPLLEAGAMLHDISRTEPDHAAAGARRAAELGVPAVAPLIIGHMDLSGVPENEISEALLVYYADKLVLGDRPCTLEERFAHRRAQTDESLRPVLERRWRQARAVRALIERVSGCSL